MSSTTEVVMTSYLRAVAVGVFLGALGFIAWPGSTSPAAAQTATKQPQAGGDDALFGLTKVHAFPLDMAAAAWSKMQPPPGMKFPGPPGFGPAAKKGDDKKAAEAADVHKSAGVFSTEFPWAGGNLTAAGVALPNVGVRYK